MTSNIYNYRKENNMNGERKLNDAGKIAKTTKPVPGPLKNELNGTMLHVPVPTIHGSWDAMSNVCQGFQWKLHSQGKFCFMLNNCWYFCIKLC